MLTRRDILFAGATGLIGSAIGSSTASALAWVPPGKGFSQHVLQNGLRVHCVATTSGIVTAGLTLRSDLVLGNFGLAHLLEHTSFSGAAGGRSAAEVKALRKSLIQDANAATWTEGIEWQVSFLPKYLDAAFELLSTTSLDQRFDIPTVATEARVVEEELLLDQHGTEQGTRAGTNAYLFGADHPFAADTLAAELAVARRPVTQLAPEMRAFAARLRLPANMDLIVVGDLDPADVLKAAAASFGRFEAAKGPILQLPRTPRSHKHRIIEGRTGEFRKPLSKVQVCWNSGVALDDPDAGAMMMLGDFINDMLETDVREQNGEAYSPTAEYDPGICSGIVAIEVTSSKAPDRIERSVFKGLAGIGDRIDAAALIRFQEQWQLERLRVQESSRDMLDLYTGRIIDGGSAYDIDIDAVTPDQVRQSADAHLPDRGGAYAKVILRGL